jgi:hypothetical protein
MGFRWRVSVGPRLSLVATTNPYVTGVATIAARERQRLLVRIYADLAELAAEAFRNGTALRPQRIESILVVRGYEPFLSIRIAFFVSTSTTTTTQVDCVLLFSSLPMRYVVVSVGGGPRSSERAMRSASTIPAAAA